jgi:hypothetical protein
MHEGILLIHPQGTDRIAVSGSQIMNLGSQENWLIDPPYQRAGRSYRYNAIDYDALGRWSRTRKGFRQVCEAGGAKWLPFEPIATSRRYRQGGSDLSVEALFEMEGG